ncbi:MAG TPA: class I SAM-dependent methyltransferase [Terriglobales bacterium]|jgi:methylase of polypeptide subunit release factors|nr:class I SAM-dependent methyltransferase [Terriglobales bacterium]
MARFGMSQLHDPRIRDNRAARLFVKAFGGFDTGSSHLHFIRIFRCVEAQCNLRRILDAGCGRGKFSFWVAQNYPSIQVDACDVREESIAVCKATAAKMGMSNVNFWVQDLTTVLSEGTYDFVFSNHVLEHIPKNQLVLANLVRAMRNGGQIYIQIPTATQSRFSFGRKFVQAHEQWAEEEHTGQTLTLDSLRAELEGLGCTVIIAKHTEGPIGEFRFELEEMALTYFNSSVLFALFFPALKLLGHVDSRLDYARGNGILVLACKPGHNQELSARSSTNNIGGQKWSGSELAIPC